VQIFDAFISVILYNHNYTINTILVQRLSHEISRFSKRIFISFTRC